MKAKYSVLVSLVAVFALVAVAGLAAAPTENLTVPAGGNQTVNLGNYQDGDDLWITWSTSTLMEVSGVLNGPAGYSESISASWLVSEDFELPQNGAYSLTLSNAGSTDASVSLTWEATPFSPGGFFDDLVTLVIVIAVVIIVIIVVIVVLVFVLGKKKKQQAMVATSPPGIITPTTPGMCPVCGAQTDTNAQFCAKCGARYR